MIHIGIDPGAAGAIAVLDSKGALHAVFDMPADAVKVGKTSRNRVSAAGVAAILGQFIGASAIIEAVNAMPGQGVSSSFAFGRALGIVEAACAAQEISVTLATPQQWKKATGCPTGKDGARARACQVFPADAERFRRVKDDGRAEAALIAWHGWKAARTA